MCHAAPNQSITANVTLPPSFPSQDQAAGVMKAEGPINAALPGGRSECRNFCSATFNGTWLRSIDRLAEISSTVVSSHIGRWLKEEPQMGDVFSPHCGPKIYPIEYASGSVEQHCSLR